MDDYDKEMQEMIDEYFECKAENGFTAWEDKLLEETLKENDELKEMLFDYIELTQDLLKSVVTLKIENAILKSKYKGE